MLMSQAYQGACIILPTKHAKSIAIAPPFWERLGASVLEYVIDTHILDNIATNDVGEKVICDADIGHISACQSSLNDMSIGRNRKM